MNLRRMFLGLLLIVATQVHAAPFAYITSEVDGTVSVIDTATNVVVTTIPVGRFPLGVAVNAAGTRAYIGNYADNSISVIDTATNTVIDLISVSPNLVQGIAVSQDGSRVYAAGGELGIVSVIDTATDTVIATIPVGRAPRSVAVNPAGTRVYVGNSTDNDHGGFTVIDATNNAAATRTPLRKPAKSIAPPTITPMKATAISPEMRETALLTAEPIPLWAGSTA